MVAFRNFKTLFRVLCLLGFLISRKDPSNFAVFLFIQVAVAVKYVSVGSCCDDLMNSNPIKASNLEAFYSHIRSPHDYLEYNISVVLSYLHTYLMWAEVVQWDNPSFTLIKFITVIHSFFSQLTCFSFGQTQSLYFGLDLNYLESSLNTITSYLNMYDRYVALLDSLHLFI